jgi:hypothetical protein
MPSSVWIRIRSEIFLPDAKSESETRVEIQKLWKLKRSSSGPWTLTSDSRFDHFDEYRDPDPVPHQSKKSDPDLHQSVSDPQHCQKDRKITDIDRYTDIEQETGRYSQRQKNRQRQTVSRQAGKQASRHLIEVRRAGNHSM